MNEKKINKILILHFNFILEIPLKINDIKKINALQFDKRNPFKTEQRPIRPTRHKTGNKERK